MSVQLMIPPAPAPEIYPQIAVATGALVYLAGQVARDAAGIPSARATWPPRSSRRTSTSRPPCAAAGTLTTWRLTVYVVDWRPDRLPDLGAGVARAAARLGRDLTKPVTLIPVVALTEPDLLVEVEAVAVLS